jgi:spore maturation protein CgeB
LNKEIIQRERELINRLLGISSIDNPSQNYQKEHPPINNTAEEVSQKDYSPRNFLHINNDYEQILYAEDKKIIINNKSISIKQETKGTYISFYERNINFSSGPNSDKKIKVDPKNQFYIRFKGQNTEKLKAQLFVIFYSDKKKLGVYTIDLNKENIIIPRNTAKYMRLAIRLSGEGKLDLDEIKIDCKRKLDFIGYKNVKALGYDQPKKLKDIRIACIFDEFTTECYKGMCELMAIRPDDWKAQFTIKRPHFLMVESAWVGNNNAWNRKVAYTSEDNVKELKELVEWCKGQGIPTVFWNKEDPVHYNVFVKTAELFDYIFTTDENRVNTYRADTGNENVYVLPFAAQPVIHNPIKFTERDSKACFAGSYYASKYPERQQDIQTLLDAALETIGIEIYDRKFGIKDKDFLFPERFIPYIKGSLKPTQLHIANKGYRVMLNVNSVKESPTMFSRRVFEGLACGTPVVSSYAEGIDNLFNELVVASDDIELLKQELSKLDKDTQYYEDKKIRGIREVLSKHTYQHRLTDILDKIGIKVDNQEKSVNMLVSLQNVEQLDSVLEVFYKQSYQNKKLTFLIDNDEKFIQSINRLKQEDITFMNINYYNERKINLGEYIQEDFVCVINPKSIYEKYYLEDLVLGNMYAKADIIGKQCYFEKNYTKEIKGKQYAYVDSLNKERCIVNRRVYSQYTHLELMQLLTEGNIELFSVGYRLFSVDKYNYSK